MQHDQVVKSLLAERSKALGFVRAVLGRWEGAEDIFQDAALLAIAKSDEIVDEQHLMAWLRLTCRNLARNSLRRSAQTTLTLSDEALDLLEGHWSRHADEPSDALRALNDCLAKLPPKSLEMIQWRYMDGLEVDRIAERVGRPMASLYVTFSRISAALADCIERQLRAERRPVNG